MCPVSPPRCILQLMTTLPWLETPPAATEPPTALPFAMPPAVRSLSLRFLPSAREQGTVFEQLGITNLGALARTPASALTGDEAFGPDGLAQMRAEYAQLLADPAIILLRVPDARADLDDRDTVLEALRGATDVATEAAAALSTLPARRRSMLLQRWQTEHGKRHTLEAVALAHGLTRERARQVVVREEYHLARLGLVLPRCNAVILLVETAGGALPTDDVIERSTRLGIPLDLDTLNLVSAVSAFGLTEVRLAFEPHYGLWTTPGGFDRWIASQRLDKDGREMGQRVRRSLDRLGAIPLTVTEGCTHWGVDHALLLANIRREDHKLVAGHLVPRSGGLSVLERAVLEMLAVAPVLPLTEVQAGSRSHCRGRRAHQPGRFC